MILRKFNQHIQSENWFAVSVDFFVVVVGIFVGLQVEGWNQDRKDKIDANRFLERIYEDQKATISPIKESQKNHEITSKLLSEITEYLQGKRTEIPTKDDLDRALCQWFIQDSIAIQSSAYDELLSTGRLSLIADENLRILIQQVYEGHAVTEGNFRFFGDSITNMAIELKPFINWYIIPIDEVLVGTANNSGTKCNIDLEAMKKSDNAKSVLAQLYRSQLIYDYWRREQVAAIEKVIDYMRDTKQGLSVK